MLTGVILVAAVAATAAFANAITGPSSSQSPYLVRSQPGVVTKAILTVGDGVDGYRLAGLPDGLGAFDNGNGTFTVLMNHEIRPGLGSVRTHGSDGAFVSKWIIDKETLQVLHGEDLIKNLNLVTGTTALNRLCSADLPELSAFYNAANGKGYNGRLFMDGEESGTEGRGFAHALDGTTWELPALGRFSWENSVANPATGDKTVTIGTDDSTPGQVYIYIGDKTGSGSPVEKAGLTNGKLFGVKVDGLRTETNATSLPAGGASFTLFDLGSRLAKTGAQLETDSDTGGVTEFLRPEDSSWDPTDPSRFYFVTTNGFNVPSRLWQLTFNDLSNPAAGGVIKMVLDGTEGQQMFDNITVNDRGQVLLQEDPGNQPYNARIWRYYPATDALSEVAHHDPQRFEAGGSSFLTQDEESSGIIPAPFLGEGWYLADDQAHYTIPGELVEGGQLFALHIPPGKQ